MNTSSIQAGFRYDWEIIGKDGVVTDAWTDHNIMPAQGLDYMLNCSFRGSGQETSWYIAVFSGDYTPRAGLTAADFSATAGEAIGYVSGTRPAFTPSASAGGAIDNAASRAEFVSTTDVTLYGGAILSANTKASTAGVVASVVRFGSPKSFPIGSTLRVTAGLAFFSY